MRGAFIRLACAGALVVFAAEKPHRLHAQAAAPPTQAPARGQPPATGRGGRGGATPGQGRAETPAPTLDVAAIDRFLGKPGQTIGDVYKISFPRSDLNVIVGGVKIKPGFALGGWAAFKLAPTGNQAVAHGDLVLTEAEVNPVISALQQHDFDITALHNHLLNASPMTMYVHFWAEGSPASLAASLRDVLGKTKTPLTDAVNLVNPVNDDLSVDKADRIQEAVGLKGTVANGVLSLSQPRPETIEMMGVTLPPSMGMATSMNFQSAGGESVAATGDFVMIADEVNRVARTLRARDIEITALHNHMMHGSPELYFMHFWAVGDPAKIGAGLKAALGQLKKVG
jgi:uncharacterized protein DUF1259